MGGDHATPYYAPFRVLVALSVCPRGLAHTRRTQVNLRHGNFTSTHPRNSVPHLMISLRTTKFTSAGPNLDRFELASSLEPLADPVDLAFVVLSSLRAFTKFASSISKKNTAELQYIFFCTHQGIFHLAYCWFPCILCPPGVLKPDHLHNRVLGFPQYLTGLNTIIYLQASYRLCGFLFNGRHHPCFYGPQHNPNHEHASEHGAQLFTSVPAPIHRAGKQQAAISVDAPPETAIQKQHPESNAKPQRAQ